MAGAVLDNDTGDLLEYRQLIKAPKHEMLWRGQHGKEIGRLAQGLEGVVEGTETMKFIRRDDVPADRKKDVAHVRIVCDVRPEKKTNIE